MGKRKRISSESFSESPQLDRRLHRSHSSLPHRSRKPSLQVSDPATSGRGSTSTSSHKIIFNDENLDTHQKHQPVLKPTKGWHDHGQHSEGRKCISVTTHADCSPVAHHRQPIIDIIPAKQPGRLHNSMNQREQHSPEQTKITLSYKAEDTPTKKPLHHNRISFPSRTANHSDSPPLPVKIKVPVDPKLSSEYIKERQKKQRRNIDDNLAKHRTFSSHANGPTDSETDSDSGSADRIRESSARRKEKRGMASNTYAAGGESTFTPRHPGYKPRSESESETSSDSELSSETESNDDSASHTTPDSDCASSTSTSSSSTLASSSTSSTSSSTSSEMSADHEIVSISDTGEKDSHVNRPLNREEHRLVGKISRDRKSGDKKKREMKRRKHSFNDDAKAYMKSGRELLKAEAEKTISIVGKRLERERRRQNKTDRKGKTKSTIVPTGKEKNSSSGKGTRSANKVIESSLLSELAEVIPSYILKSSKQLLQKDRKDGLETENKEHAVGVETNNDKNLSPEGKKGQISKHAVVLKAALTTILRLSARNISAAGGGRVIQNSHGENTMKNEDFTNTSKTNSNTKNGGGVDGRSQHSQTGLEHDLARIAREREQRIEILELELRNYRQ